MKLRIAESVFHGGSIEFKFNQIGLDPNGHNKE
jgi:hypothetical protein